jgi:ribose/xylose/arabinose/galactoside ABC-type transport system permease subunit
VVDQSVGWQNVSLLCALGLLVAIIGARNSDFFLVQNFFNIGAAVALLGLVSVVQTIVIVSGGLDISVGSTAGLASVVAAEAMLHVNSAAVGIAAGLGIGLVAGLFNGLLVTAFKLNAVIATLATYSAYQGFAYLVTNGVSISVSNSAFNNIGSGTVFGIPISVVILAVVALALIAFMRTTDIGRNIYAMGGNPIAARLAGIPVERYKLGIYGFAGLIAGLAGVILTARTTAGQPGSGTQDLALTSITAVLLGGTALAGGRGTIFGTVLGVLIIGTLDDGLILLNISSFYQLVAQGTVLIFAVIIQVRPWQQWQWMPSKRRV